MKHKFEINSNILSFANMLREISHVAHNYVLQPPSHMWRFQTAYIWVGSQGVLGILDKDHICASLWGPHIVYDFCNMWNTCVITVSHVKSIWNFTKKLQLCSTYEFLFLYVWSNVAFFAWESFHVQFFRWETFCMWLYSDEKLFICDFSHAKFHMWSSTFGIWHVQLHMGNFTCHYDFPHWKLISQFSDHSHKWNSPCDSNVKKCEIYF